MSHVDDIISYTSKSTGEHGGCIDPNQAVTNCESAQGGKALVSHRATFQQIIKNLCSSLTKTSADIHGLNC